ncbi:4-amino-4-deoxy-L-arabinose transferase [Amycolatopsis xylanica]|uniref:4-amino-4-deoxy-L-arabinose transferase n=1 Tax=Amycolatopsis xylanica TaxID=589385 RepID=A0A1H3GKR3_9PSEU|nr:glycosyltransferase family 39 protein [Amycolatopsis xylanica]SDY03913.1 4-amino-4-deoxy-L-arabinose transferase [Amycolatopsis xylanica]
MNGIHTFARWPVLAIAAVAGVVLLLTSGRYGHGFDEAYFLVAGRDHLNWGYFDQPPLIPLLAGGLDSLFPGNLVVLRLPMTLAAMGGIVVTALIARELGGRRAAQVMAAAAYACSSALIMSHWIATYALDPVLWTVIVWLVVRWVRVRDDRLLLLAGVVTAISLQTKFLIPAFWVLLALSALVLGPRDLLRRPMLWAGAAIAVAVTIPNLVWQARNGWPYAHMNEVVKAEFPGVVPFLRDGLLGAGVGIGVLAFLYGLWRLLRSPDLRPYRFLGVTMIALIVAFLLAQGRSYYLIGIYALPFAAAAAELERRRLVRWWKAVAWPAFVLSAVVTVAALPIYPASTVDKLPTSFGIVTLGTSFAGGELPVAQLAETVDGIWASMPPEERAHTAVYAEIYPFAAAVERDGRAHGIDRVYSGHRGYWYFGAPPESADSVLFFGFDPGLLKPHFATMTPVVDGLVWRYTGKLAPWKQIWPLLKRQ